MSEERRNLTRRKFAYYMQVIDAQTQTLVGYLDDISPQGFQLDGRTPFVVNRDYSLRLDLTTEISDRPFLSFVARCRWSKPDPVDPMSFDAGFQILSITPREDEIFQRIVAKYGTQATLW